MRAFYICVSDILADCFNVILCDQGICATTCCTNSKPTYSSAIIRIYFKFLKEFSGPIYEQVENAMNFAKMYIARKGIITELQRKDEYDIPLIAIKEAVTKEVIKATGLSESGTRKIFSSLQSKGMIKAIGEGRNRRYHLIASQKS